MFARYAGEFAERFKDVYLYTPINEIYIAATFSGQLDLWNERANSDRGFVAALNNLCKANVLAMEEILKVNTGAVFIQSESTEYFHPETADDVLATDFLNRKHFLSLDLSYGRPVDSAMHKYLKENGMSDEDYEFFMWREITPDETPETKNKRTRLQRMLRSCVMGTDYYATNEHWVDGATHPDNNPFHYRESGEIFGYYVMHTETNRADPDGGPDEAQDWLQKQWANVLRLKQDGVPIVEFTWYGLVDLVGWDDLLRNNNTDLVPAVLCTLDRTVRAVGRSYKRLIGSWGPHLREPDLSVRGAPQGLKPLTAGVDPKRPNAVQRAKRAARGFKALHREIP
jgi:hypothetical protein